MAAVGGGREFTPTAAGAEPAGFLVGIRMCSSGRDFADVAVEAGHREPDLAAAGGFDDALVRKTVATLIDRLVDSDTAARVLGHSSDAITKEFYIE